MARGEMRAAFLAAPPAVAVPFCAGGYRQRDEQKGPAGLSLPAALVPSSTPGCSSQVPPGRSLLASVWSRSSPG